MSVSSSNDYGNHFDDDDDDITMNSDEDDAMPPQPPTTMMNFMNFSGGSRSMVVGKGSGRDNSVTGNVATLTEQSSDFRFKLSAPQVSSDEDDDISDVKNTMVGEFHNHHNDNDRLAQHYQQQMQQQQQQSDQSLKSSPGSDAGEQNQYLKVLPEYNHFNNIARNRQSASWGTLVAPGETTSSRPIFGTPPGSPTKSQRSTTGQPQSPMKSQMRSQERNSISIKELQKQRQKPQQHRNSSISASDMRIFEENFGTTSAETNNHRQSSSSFQNSSTLRMSHVQGRNSLVQIRLEPVDQPVNNHEQHAVRTNVSPKQLCALQCIGITILVLFVAVVIMIILVVTQDKK